MQQYLSLLREIKEKGTHKPPAREGMPGSLSLFGAQFRHDLSEGFPLLTTKKMYWKGVVTELLWFLRGDTNIRYLVRNGCNIWNEDAYNFYLKTMKRLYNDNPPFKLLSFEEFISILSNPGNEDWSHSTYMLGDCGYQYGKVWRDWEGKLIEAQQNPGINRRVSVSFAHIDQIANLIKGLKESTESRRHIVTSIDVAHDNDLALYWCHALSQFNCRPLTYYERCELATIDENSGIPMVAKTPRYKLDCHMYQRSADAFLGVPFNIASYALLTEILAKICNMVPGDLITSYGDLHIYDNHLDAVDEQLSRTPDKLPKLQIFSSPQMDLSEVNNWTWEDFVIHNYIPQPAIKAKLSTGLK